MSPKEKYCGVIVPMITPLKKNLNIDHEAVEKIVNRFNENRCNTFVLGTTGESSSISKEKKINLVESTIRAVNDENIVYVGISGNCFEETIDSAKKYSDLGADVLVAHLPYYFPLDEKHILTYFEKLANSVPLPLMVYNIPVTTNLSIPLNLIEKLSYHENIIGVKDSQRGEDRLNESIKLWKNRTDFTFHLGWAAMSSYGLQNGIDGIVPSSANLVPNLYRNLYDASKSGDVKIAEEIQDVTNMISAYYQEGQLLSRAFPILKVMMNAFGLCDPYVALPLETLNSDEIVTIKNEVLDKLYKYKNQSNLSSK